MHTIRFGRWSRSLGVERPQSSGSRAPRLSGAVLMVGAVLICTPVTAQQDMIRGTVLQQQTLQPVAGAQIVAEGTQTGAITDAGGRFTITGLAGTQITLEVIMVGYRTARQTVPLGATDVRILLAETAVELEGIVVTGTPGEARARTVGNAVARIRAEEDLQIKPVRDVQELLKGAAPGVTVRTGQGNVGTGGVIRMRGVTSLSLSNQPLIYIDGIRVNNDFRSGPSIRGGSQTSRINDINPEEIESIEIIKGPAAATLYGTEASNGVIQIITKRGTEGAPTWNLTVKQGANYFRDPAGRLPTNYSLGPSGDLISQNLFDEEVAAGRNPLQTGHSQGYDLNVRGGTEGIRYFASAAWDDTEGIVDYNWQKKLSARGNIQIVPNENLSATVNVGVVSSETRYGQAASGWDLMGQFTWGNPRSRDGRLRGFLRATPEAAATIQSFSEVLRATVGTTVDYRPFEWLNARMNVGLDMTDEENSILFPRHPTGSAYFFGSRSLGEKNAERKAVRNATVDLGATADFDLTEAISSATSMGFQYFTKETEGLTGRGLVFPAPPVTTIGGAAQTFSGESYVANKTVGVYVQERVGFNNRLFLTAAVRGDDNSAFGQNFDFVIYPKVSAAWVVNEESFFNVPWVNTLKLRGAWGQAGQQPDVFAAIRLYQPATGPGDSSILTPRTIGNPDLEPERGEELELGFDAALLDDRLGIDFTMYNQSRKNAIIGAPVPPSSGFPGVRFVNVGQLDSWGIELGIDAQLVQQENVVWSLGVNIGTNNSEVVDLGEFSDLGAGFAGQIHRVGYPVSAYFLRRVVSADLDGAGNVINSMCEGQDGGSPVPCDGAPRVFAGQPDPKLTGNINSSVSLFGNLRLSAEVDFQTGHKSVTGDIAGAHHLFRNTRAILTNSHPVLEAYDQISGFSWFHSGLYGAGWAKLRNVSATYTLPEEMVSGIGASRASLTLSAQNLAILWQQTEELFGRRIIDPENRLTSSETGGYVQTVLPHLSSFVATMRLTF